MELSILCKCTIIILPIVQLLRLMTIGTTIDIHILQFRRSKVQKEKQPYKNKGKIDNDVNYSLRKVDQLTGSKYDHNSYEYVEDGAVKSGDDSGYVDISDSQIKQQSRTKHHKDSAPSNNVPVLSCTKTASSNVHESVESTSKTPNISTNNFHYSLSRIPKTEIDGERQFINNSTYDHFNNGEEVVINTSYDEVQFRQNETDYDQFTEATHVGNTQVVDATYDYVPTNTENNYDEFNHQTDTNDNDYDHTCIGTDG